jgi:hypothetical protein
MTPARETSHTGRHRHGEPDQTDRQRRSEPNQTDRHKPAEPSEDEELVMYLERDQLVSDRSKPVARASLGRRATQALWALRIFVVVVSFMVIYTFIAQLH